MNDRIPHSKLIMLNVMGHCPHLSDPKQTADAIQEFLAAA